MLEPVLEPVSADAVLLSDTTTSSGAAIVIWHEPKKTANSRRCWRKPRMMDAVLIDVVLVDVF